MKTHNALRSILVFPIIVMPVGCTGLFWSLTECTDLELIRSGDGTKTILAYFSIGEAEDYRYNFESGQENRVTRRPSKGAPCRLGLANRDWPGNYKVQYWSQAWHEIVLAYLDEIINVGFDGVYLEMIREAGNAVIVVDYVDDGSDSSVNDDRIASFRLKATADGFIPYAAIEDRALDSINYLDFEKITRKTVDQTSKISDRGFASVGVSVHNVRGA